MNDYWKIDRSSMRTRIFLYIIRVPHKCRTYEPLKNSVPIGGPVPTAHQSTSSPPFRFAPCSPLTAAKYPFKPAIGSRKRCKLPRGVRGIAQATVAFCYIVCS